MAQAHLTPHLARTEEALIVLFCLIDDAYYRLNPEGPRYASLKRLSDSEILTLALFQQLRGVASEHSFLRDDVGRFFSHLFPGAGGRGLVPGNSLHRPPPSQARTLPGVPQARHPPARVLVGERREPETLIVDSTLLEVAHPRQVKQSAGFSKERGE